MKLLPAARLIAGAQLAVALLAQLAMAYDSAAYKDPHYADGRTTMVHLFEWRHKDVALECERFLGPAGYAGVQVSPINENVVIEGRPWFERYQPLSYKLVTRSGDEAEFRDMVERCNRVGVRIYVDAVINHMAADQVYSPAVGTAGSRADPAKRQYPDVPYGPGDFNQVCGINDYGNPNEVRNCELSGLHDLNQGKEYVRAKIVEFLDHVVDLGVAGFRIDAAKHMWPGDLEAIYSRVKNLREDVYGANKRPFIYQEVIDLGGERIRKYEYNNLGAVIEFVYGNVLGRCFRGWESLSGLENWGFQNRYLLPTWDVVVMVDNHDNQRGHGAGGEAILNYKSPRLYKMAVAFMLAHPYGHARVMSSFDFSDPSQGPPADENGNILSPVPVTRDIGAGEAPELCDNGWVCEHRWSPIYQMAQFRNVVKDALLTNWWSNGRNKIAFSRGNLGFVAFNGQYGEDLREKLQTGLPAGDYCDVISGRRHAGKCTGKTVRVEDDGTARIEILKDEPDGVLAIHAQSRL